jgi:hypothetical protein
VPKKHKFIISEMLKNKAFIFNKCRGGTDLPYMSKGTKEREREKKYSLSNLILRRTASKSPLE